MRIKHTPGPWAIYCCEPGQRNGVIYSESLPESSASICDLTADTCIKDNDRRRGDKWVYSEQRAADARLMAAAPDLLAALSEMLSASDLGDLDSLANAAQSARAAIAKAWGNA